MCLCVFLCLCLCLFVCLFVWCLGMIVFLCHSWKVREFVDISVSIRSLTQRITISSNFWDQYGTKFLSTNSTFPALSGVRDVFFVACEHDPRHFCRNRINKVRVLTRSPETDWADRWMSFLVAAQAQSYTKIIPSSRNLGLSS